MKRIIAMLLAIVMLVGNVPVQAFATEIPQEILACVTEGCTYGAGHEGNCSNYVEPCGTTGCEYAAGHEGYCSNYVACETIGCEYEAGHTGNCSNYVEPCATSGCEYAAGHEGHCSNYVDPEEPSTEKLAVQNVIALIEAIGEVTLESESAIDAADQAYCNLTEEQKEMVTNFQTLETAKSAYMALSIPVPADEEAPEPVSVTVSFTAQCGGEFLLPPQLEMTVFSDTAENYGFGDQTDRATQVSTMDVLVAAHVVACDDFAQDNAQEYLVADGNFITKMFGEENGGDVCLLVNGFQPGTDGVQQAVVKEEDSVELFIYQRKDFKDKYIWLALPDGNKADGQEVYGGRNVQVVVKGYSPFSYGYEGDEGETVISGATIYMVDIDSGELTSLGVTSDATGTATITVPTSYIGQTVYLVAKGTETAMTLAKVEVVEAPVNAEFKLSSLELAVGGSSMDAASVQTLTPAFDGATAEYATPILNYENDKNQRFVWLKVTAPEAATVTAQCGSSEVTTLTSGEWGIVQVKGGYFYAPTYSGCLTPGEYNKVIITLSQENETDKVYTVTVPMQPDTSNQSLKWKTDLKEALYITQNAEDAALTVAAEYQNRPLENTDVITYQWYSNTSASAENGVPIDGATQASYNPNVADLGTVYYYVVASCGELKSITSKVITVTVTQKAAPKSVSIVCDYPYTIPNDWGMALGGVTFVAKVGGTLQLKAVDENGEETPVEWLDKGINGGTLDKATGAYTISSTSYSYVQAASLYDANIKSEEKAILVEDYSFSESNKTPSATLASDGQSATKISAPGGLKDYNIWTYTVSPENAAELISGVEEKGNWLSFNALRPGTIQASFDLDLDGDGLGDGKGLSDNATMTIKGIAVEDAEGKLTKTYLETSAASPTPTVQLTAISSTEGDTVAWSSADESVATVNESGLVTAKGIGSVIITAKGTEYTGGIKVVVTSAEKPYLEAIDFQADRAGVNPSTWKTATFKAATLSYTGLKMYGYSVTTLTLKNTTLYNADKYVAIATYTDANGEDQSLPVNSGAVTSLPNIPFGTNTITITLTDKADETKKTVYTFEITRPRDTTKIIASNGIVFTPVGREKWENKYQNKAEGIMYVANQDGSFAQYQGVNSNRLYYRTYAMNGLEAFTLTLKGSSAYTHIRYSTDDGTTWKYLGQTGTGGQVTGNITFPEAAAEGANPVTKVTVQILDDVTYAANIAAGKDGFADSTPSSYYVWVEQIPVLNEDCDILTAETNHGDWYPTFREDIQNYRLMVANGAAAPVLTFTVSEDATVRIGDTAAVPTDGKYTLTLTNTDQNITVTSSSGNTEKTYTFGYSQKSAKAVPDKVVDYLLINGQYVNGGGGAYGTMPQATLGDNGLTSLGNFGGYVTYYYENGLTDDPNNAYGVDFYVDANAFEDTTTGSGLGSMEPGQVWVSEDGNTWYALAGSEHYEDTTIWDYTVTYAKTGTGGTGWEDNRGNSHSTTHGRSFAWPEVKHYPLNSQLADGGNIVLSGILLPCADGTITGSDTFGSYSKGGRFGYVDLLPNGTNNPYLDNSNYTNTSTGFDLAWAVDSSGNPVNVSGKTFHYVKIVTASNIMAGSANEKSTEVGQVRRAAVGASPVGKTTAPTGVTFVKGEETYTYTFGEGQRIFEILVPKGMTSAAVRLEGTDEADNIYINNQRTVSGTASREYSFSTETQELIRIIVQNGEKEPVIYLLKVKEDTAVEGPLSALKFASGSDATAAAYTMTPAFDPAVRTYTLVVPDSSSSVYAWATLKEGAEGTIQAVYTNTSGAENKVTITSGKSTGQSLSKAEASGKLEGNIITITVDDVTAYTVNILRQATLNKLALTVGEDPVTLTPAFKATIQEYQADIAHNAVLTVTPTVRTNGAEVTINQTAVESGTAANITPVWTNRTSDLVLQVSGGEGTISSTYTIHLAQLAARLEIAAPPTKTTYAAGEAFDPAGMQVRAVYNDGFTEIVEPSAYTYAPAGALSPGDREINITFDGKTAKQSISVSSTLQGNGTQSDPFLIYTAQDYQTVYDLVAKGVSFDGEYFKQMADITLADGWKPIGVLIDPSVGHIDKGKNMYAFSGNLDGNGKLLTVPEGGLPLLGYVQNASVRNLNIFGKKIAGYGLVNHLEGVNLSGNAITIENVTLKSGTSTLKSGLIGTYLTNNQYSGCTRNFVVTIKNCTVEQGVVIGYNKDQSMIGSIAGRIHGTVENCTSHASVYGKDYVGGILGTRDNALATCSITGCTFTGSVEGTGEHVGGIAGGGYENSTSPNGVHIVVNNCTVSGSVTGKDKVGGILGGDTYVAQAWNEVTFKNNTFTGTVRATGGTYVGGIIGYYMSLNKMDDITGNYYKLGCGADKGIGFIQYVDTNCENHETASGATYINTETSTTDCPKVTGCAWKKAHNRTDDPLGADAAKLCYTDTEQDPIAVELKVSGNYKTEYLLGETLNLTGMTLTVVYNDASTENIALADATVTGYDANEVGNQKVTISYQGLTAEIMVTVKNPSTNITVTVSVLGDSAHGDNGTVHTLANGGLKTWVSAKSYTVDSNATVWDVLQQVFRANGIHCDYENSLGTIYISSLSYNGVTLSEFDNGPNSGWQYTLNGSHPLNGVAQQHLKNGDRIVFHYTDDFNLEQGGNGGSGSGNTQSAVEAVEKLIDAIGNVTLNSADAINKARAAYNKLSASEQEKVSNYAKLTDAEAKLSNLQIKNAETMIGKIGTVTLNSIDKINDAWNAYNALTTEQKLKVSNRGVLGDAQDRYDNLRADEVEALIDQIDAQITLNSETAIGKARKAYDALSETQQALVDKEHLDKLKAAELALANLKATEEDKEKAQEVINRIDKLDDITLDSEKDILAAREAYEKLTDIQKALVTNYDLLVSAEKTMDGLKRYAIFENAYTSTGDYLENLGTPAVGSIGGEWMVLGLIRSGRNVSEEYYQRVVSYVRENIDENGRLHRAKSSENSRLILALTALGKDVTNVDGYNLLRGLSDMEFVQYQGINGPIWALVALDCGNYPAPEGNVSRESLIQIILDAQLSDGGWALSGEEADGDITGMALLALAPYYGKNDAVKLAVEDGLMLLSNIQNADGTFGTFDGGDSRVATCESSAQVIVALTALGIDPAKDVRFIKNGISALDALIEFYVTGGGFKHLMVGQLDGMATEQAYYAMTAYYRFLMGENHLFDMTDQIDRGGDVRLDKSMETAEIPVASEIEEPDSGNAVVIWIGVMTVCVAAITVLLLNRKKLFGKFL